MPRLLIALVALGCASVLAGCDWILESTYQIRDPDPQRALTLDRELEEFFGLIDAVARKRDMHAIPCPPSQSQAICRRYRTRDGIFMTGYLDPKNNQYVFSVYEWNVRRRAERGLEIEAEGLAALRRRFGENVAKKEPPPARAPRPSPDQDRR